MEEPVKTETEPIGLITDSGRGLISQEDNQKPFNISSQSKPSSTPDLLKETPRTCYSFVERANFLSLLHFFFGLPFIYRANKEKKKKLTMDNLGPIGLTESSEYLEKKFTQTFYEWRAKDPKKRRAIEIEILSFFKKDYAIQLFWQLVQGFARILAAFFLYHMLTDLRNPLGNPRDAYIPSIGLFLCNIVAFYALHQAGFNVTYSANKLRAGLLAMVFRKITKLSPTAVHNLNLGKLINVMASDTNSLERAHILTFVSAPLIFLGGFGMLYYFWGPSCLVGLGYMAASWILQFFLPFKTIGLRIKGKVDGDERLKYMNDTIEAIRTIKVFGWEFNIIEKIEKTRDIEIKDVKAAAYLDCVPRAIVYTSHWIGGFLIYLVFTSCVGPLSANKTFPSMIVMNVLRQFCMLQFFSVMGFFFEMKGFALRIISIMNLPEIEPAADIVPCKDPENAIEFEDFTGYWMNRNLEVNPPPPAPKLKLKGLKIQGLPVWKAPPNKIPIDEYNPAISHINLNIKKGNLTVVIGPIGSGKSSLLASLMGEMAYSEGGLRYSGKYVHMGQNPSLGLGKIREIIVSLQEYDAQKFRRVVEACNLSFDLKNLPEGEDTNVGERGIILNEGQKARIILARMIYQDADIYLLDDPFGYMNWDSAKHIFHSALQGLLKNKTVVLVTYRVYTLRFADQIIVMNKGEISVKGTPEEIKASKVDINSLIGFKSDVPFVVVENGHGDGAPRSKQILEEVEEEEKIPLSEETQDFVASRQDEGLILEDEKLDDGKVTWRTYWQYFKVLFNPFTFIIFGVLFAAGEIYAWLYLFFLGKWARGLWSNHLSYAVIGPVVFSSIFVHILKYLMYFGLTLNASKKIHNKMLRSVYMAPIIFFDKNPLGRVLSRFAVDVGIIDRNVQASLLEILEGFTLFMVYLFSLWVTEAWILVTAGSVLIIGVLFYLWCRKAVYESRGLELIARAPMYSLYSQAVDNLATIRARKLSDWLIRRFYSRVDDYSRANIHYMVSARVLRFWIDYVGELGVIVTICIFISANSQTLAIGYFFNILISLTTTMSWILRSFLTLDLFMSSVARVTTFIERAKTVDLIKPNDEKYMTQEGGGFPKRGDIEIRNAVLRYSAKSDPFVYNFNLDVKHGEKIAVVGGARSGFSNILAMLIRVFEIDRMPNSYITIGGINTRDVGLQVLRKPFVIIPQEVYLITGSIRQNIDPWNEHTDEQIWEVLELVRLKEYIENLKNQLKTHVSKGSSTFSMGQRQLFCMARSLLKKSAVVLQDDMAAHVDLATGHEIQQKFLERYKDSTVITMTHRVMTIAIYDKVIIMSQGVVKEVGEPYLLLAKKVGDRRITNKETEFAGLISNLGKYISKLIFRIAMHSYYKKHGLEFVKGEGDDNDESHGESDEDRRIIPHGGGLKEDEIDPGMIRIREDEEDSVMKDNDDDLMEKDDVRRNEIQKDSVRQFNKFDH